MTVRISSMLMMLNVVSSNGAFGFSLIEKKTIKKRPDWDDTKKETFS
jgi:hypothetical protein